MKLPSKKELKKTLDLIDARKDTLRHAVESVVGGYSPAMFVWGDPGLGKSHLITSMLDHLCGQTWQHHTAHTSPKGLVLSLFNSKDAIHVFEDMEGMFKSESTASILRAACGSPNDRDRRVTWENNSEKIAFNFRGGIIVATNQNLAKNSGPLQGVASRFRPLQWGMSSKERLCTILDIAEKQHVKNGVIITKQEARQVAITLCDMVLDHRLEVSLDIRLFTEHALPAFAQAKATPGMDWLELLVAKITGSTQTIEENRDQKTVRLEQLAGLIDSQGGTIKEKIAKWRELTGLNQAMYYRHLKNAKRPEVKAAKKPEVSETMRFVKEMNS